MTQRTDIIELLQREKLTVRELALRFRVATDEIATDLRHIAKSVRPQELRMEIPTCKDCGFVFRERSKLRPPSKCPQCKGMKITEPRFWIQ